MCGAVGPGAAVLALLAGRAGAGLGWRPAHQTVAVTVALASPLALLYRPASLYHPQVEKIVNVLDQLLELLDLAVLEGICLGALFARLSKVQTRLSLPVTSHNQRRKLWLHSAA